MQDEPTARLPRLADRGAAGLRRGRSGARDRCGSGHVLVCGIGAAGCGGGRQPRARFDYVAVTRTGVRTCDRQHRRPHPAHTPRSRGAHGRTPRLAGAAQGPAALLRLAARQCGRLRPPLCIRAGQALPLSATVRQPAQLVTKPAFVMAVHAELLFLPDTRCKHDYAISAAVSHRGEG
jgi:hypothetical protein